MPTKIVQGDRTMPNPANVLDSVAGRSFERMMWRPRAARGKDGFNA
jgi:hypothetical protein